MFKTDLDDILVTPQLIKSFLDYLKECGRLNGTIRKYALDLRSFYNFLPEEKYLSANSLVNWRDYLMQAGFAVRTVNTRIAACNSFLSYLDRKDWQVSPLALSCEEAVAAISRDDYYALLKAAHKLGREDLYFLVKAFCCLGLSVSDLPYLTMFALRSGRIIIESKSRTRNIYIPDTLQKEFLAYAEHICVESGPIFKPVFGDPLNKAVIVKEIGNLCSEAGIPESKRSPRSLCKLYFVTYSEIRSTSSMLYEKEYSKILMKEQRNLNLHFGEDSATVFLNHASASPEALIDSREEAAV